MESEFYERFPTFLGLSDTEEIRGGELGYTLTGDKRIDFVLRYHDKAVKIGKAFNFNPIALLAQASVESGWGTSNLSKAHNNFFGITAYGKPNQYWKGGKYVSKTSGLPFRTYATVEDGFSDFARLITSYYKEAAKVSHDISLYATKIANSPYINEKNGDNRVKYKLLILQSSETIAAIIKKKFPNLYN